MMTIKKSTLILLCTCFTALSSAFVLAEALHPLEQETGLKRFDKNVSLGGGQHSQSQQDIKGVHIGDNVLAQAIKLYDQGAKLHHIAASSRSDKVRLSFYQPYQNSRLEQLLELHFNKFSGFITRIDSTYKIESTYLPIGPILENVLQSALKKYGEPLHLSEISQIAKHPEYPIPLRTFIHNLQPNPEVAKLVIEYFNNLNISRSARFDKDESERTILYTGFNRCYFWQQDNFTEILSLCSFAPNAANAENRGVELSLINFAVVQNVADKETVKNELSLSL
ncbi:MAG: hypothetical protein ACJAUL_000723 [Paraglaciecola sp.]|jgi:hypothetical protein